LGVAENMVPPIKLAHFVLRTSRYAEMVNWYKSVFNAKGSFESEQLSFLSYDDEHHRFAILNIPDLADQPDGIAGVHHIAFTYDSLTTLLENFERLKAMNIDPAFVINHGPTTSLYYADPDGNQLELQVENFDTIEESSQFFFTPEFAKIQSAWNSTPLNFSLACVLANPNQNCAVARMSAQRISRTSNFANDARWGLTCPNN
jgi:catechol 2,3-dioxygenase-like lactoylglutathione lyase family enzyme